MFSSLVIINDNWIIYLKFLKILDKIFYNKLDVSNFFFMKMYVLELVFLNVYVCVSIK